tara:strand:+ start:481 stop:879 length:399 start_codon:yes stop_codon:yes gene_type:complete
MAYEMKGNKKPGSTYKDQLAFADKGLYGPTDHGAHDGPGDDKSMDKGIEDRLTDPMYTVTKKKSGKTKVISEKRYGKISERLAKREAKGKKTRRTVSDDSMVERFVKSANQMARQQAFKKAAEEAIQQFKRD